MLADLSLIPVGGSNHTSDVLAEVLDLIHASGLAYQLTPTTTCIEGSWDEINGLARRCHDLVRKRHAHVVTLLRIEDDGEPGPKLKRNLEAVEEKSDHLLRTQPVGADDKGRKRGAKTPDLAVGEEPLPAFAMGRSSIRT